MKPTLFITAGDPLGIGPEIVVKSLKNPRVQRACYAVVIGEETSLKKAGWTDKLGSLLPLYAPHLPQTHAPSPIGGQISFQAVETGIKLALKTACPLVTAPISKQSWQLAGISPFTGHTELLRARTQNDGLMMFVSGVKLRYFFIGFGLIGVVVIGLAITGQLGYAMTRMAGWGQALIYTNDQLWQDTYQTRNSLYAIGSGGFWGLGLGQSRQKYLYIPEVQNDFVFAVVCEELGFIGAAIILCLFALLVWRGITISMRAKDRFGSLLGIGLSAQIGLQVILNIMVITDWLPNTGISLPFFSFGGSSLIMLLAQMGIVLSISRSATLERA